MLTLEILYAVLQGLPAEYLDPSSPLEGGSLGTSFLEPPWQPFVLNIESALKQGADPASAVRSALAGMTGHERSQLCKALAQAQPVMNLPDLTRCEKETLVALRAAGVASVTQLSRLLYQDQDNLRKRLRALVDKGYAIKFHHPKGFRYFAPRRLDGSGRHGGINGGAPLRIDPSLKPSVREALKALFAESAAEAPADLPELPELQQ